MNDIVSIRHLTLGLLLTMLIFAAGCSKESRAEHHLNRAERAFLAEDYDTARIEYLNVVRIQPEHGKAIQRLAIILFDQGSPRLAAPFLARAVQLDPDNVDLRFRFALLYATAGQPDMARPEIETILERDPEHPDALLLLAELASEPEQTVSVRSRIAELRSRTGDRAAHHVAEAQLLLRAGDSAGAEAAVAQALELEPKLAQAHLAFAVLLASRTNLVAAEQSFRIAAELSPLRSERRMRHIQFKRTTGAVEDAVQLATELVTRAPDYLPAWHFRAQVAFDKGEHDEAIRAIDRILSRDPRHLEVNVLRARIHLVKGEATNAIARLEELGQVYPRHADLRYQLALAHLINRDVNRAISNLSQTVELSPNAADAVLLLAQLNLARGQSDAAIRSLIDLASKHPRDGRARLALGQAYQNRGQLDEALATYQTYRNELPRDPQGPFHVGLVLRQQNRADDARTAFQQTLELDPPHQAAAAQLVELDLAANKPDAALSRAGQLVRDHPDSAGAHLVLARVHLAADHKAPAETELKKALDLDPNARAAQLLLARLYTSSNRTQEALGELENLATRNTNDTATLLLIGTLYSEARDYDQARLAYERALNVNPNFTPALNNLAYLYADQLKQPDRAYEFARRARTLQPDDPAIADTLGWVQYHRGQYPEALNLLVESAASLPAEPEVQFHLGMTHYMLGNEDAARTALQSSLSAPSVVSWRDAAEQRLAILNLDTTNTAPAVVAQLEQMIKMHPTDVVALLRLATIHETRGAIDRAIQLCLDAVKASSGAVPPNLKLSQLYAVRPQDQTKALKQARKARALAPTDPIIAMTLGQIAFKTGDHPWAVSLLEQSASRITNRAALFFDLAWARYSVGRVSDAVAAMQTAQSPGLDTHHSVIVARFLDLASLDVEPTSAAAAYDRAQQVLKSDPAFGPALMLTALVDYRNQRILQARKTAEHVLAQYRHFSPAHRLLALLYLADPPDNDRAYSHALKAREAYPSDSEVAMALGIACHRRNDHRRAIELLQEATAKQPNEAEALYYLGLSSLQVKDIAPARVALEKVVKLQPETPLAQQASQVLKGLD